MLANTHGQIWNASEFARPFGVADTTVRNYLDLMTSALVIRHLAARVDECFFWATLGGAELDLLVVRGQGRMGFEIKRTTSPQVTPSMRSALSDLHLRSLDVIHAGETTFPMDKKIRAVAFSRLLDDIKPLR
jgi:predicted AAA+ superfamily ATPase